MQYIGSLIALLCPVKVFKNAVAEGTMLPGIVSNYLLGILWLTIGHAALQGFSNRHGSMIASFIPLLALAIPIVTAVGAFMFDFILRQIVVDGNKLGSNFKDIFLCELHVFPNMYALIYLAAAVLYSKNIILALAGLLLTLRFLEQQARIIQVVHDRTLKQSYVVIIMIAVIAAVSIFIFRRLDL